MGLLALALSGLALAGAPAVNLGDTALNFALSSVNEDAALEAVNKPSVSLADFTGPFAEYPRNAVVMYFFEQAHGGDGLAVLDRIARKYRNQSVQIVALSSDASDVVLLSRWVADQDLTFPVLRDQHRVVHGRYGVTKLPLTVVVDGQGDVFAVGTPGAADIEVEVSAAIEAVLSE